MALNRTIVVSAAVIGLTLSFAAMSSQPINAHHAEQATQEATIDPCNPTPLTPGYIVADSVFVFTEPVNTSAHLLIVKKNDVVDVLGRNQTGVWFFVKTYSDISGWVPSNYVQMDGKLLTKLQVVTSQGSMPEATDAATMAATEAETTVACPGASGTITADSLLMRASPTTTAAQVGHILKKGDAVQILLLNASGTWLEVQAGTDTGWVPLAYVFFKPGALIHIPHDYTSVEVTLTPVP